MKTTIYHDNYGETQAERVTLPTPFYGSWDERVHGQQDSTGVWIIALAWGPKSRRCFIQTYSCWQRDNSGECVGYAVGECSPTEMLQYCDRVGVEAPEGLFQSVANTVIE